ncbi:MAG: hypothetical protein LAO19_22315 [Acidobacteriia bacterium]|nr:hypothetical protein [Terriglobia bacterium]
MKLFDDLPARTLALIISAVSALLAAGCAFFATIVIGAKFFHDEMSYGIPLALGPPVAIITALTVFFIVFRKMRSLAR